MKNKSELIDGLLPCPFCARQPEMNKLAARIWCVMCDCGLEAPKDSVSREGAKRIWNRRRFIPQHPNHHHKKRMKGIELEALNKSFQKTLSNKPTSLI